jgi:hypothetical protein
MKLITKQTEVKSRVDEIVQLQLSVGSEALIVYFNVSTMVQGEPFGETFDSGAPLMVPITEIEEALRSIYAKALELRAQQIEGTTELVHVPNYPAFFDALIKLPIFALVQEHNATSLQVNAAYTDFALVLGNCIAGVENSEALQNSIDRVLTALNGSATQELLEELQEAIDANAIPVKVVDFVEEIQQ